MSRAHLGAARVLRTLAYLDEHTDETGTLQPGWPTDPDPLAYYRRLMQFARSQAEIDVDTDEEARARR
jgi:hypothetical protein